MITKNSCKIVGTKVPSIASFLELKIVGLKSEVLNRQFSIKNLTRKIIIAKKYKICKNVFFKSLGLMFSIKKDKSLIFIFKKEKISPLHMFFVFYPIDVLFLNKNKIVVEIKENFKPFTLYIPKKKSKYIIELPKQTIKKSKTKIGDKINF